MASDIPPGRDVEALSPTGKPSKASHWSILLDQAGVDDEALHHKYAGHGAPEAPFLVEFLPDDAQSPMTFPSPYKWIVTITTAVSALAVALTSSAYSSSVLQLENEFRVSHEHGGVAPPESRLPPAILGAVLLPVGLFWFAWTNGTDMHWAVPMAGSGVFGVGLVLVFLPLTNYLVESCSFLFKTSSMWRLCLRRVRWFDRCSGPMFPLFTGYMYRDRGLHWASPVPVFLSLACLPVSQLT
ncbi:hypothetical protein E4U58_002922 [Claviceps cyperi]|nr:hypothetical protein E4U58_002922 [Claviceps cyperi]